MSSCRFNKRAVQDGFTARRYGRQRGNPKWTQCGDCRNRGAILIVVLVCLVVVTTILLGAVEVSIRNRRQARTELQLEQTHWLLDAGIDVAIARFDRAGDFSEYSFATDGALKGFDGAVEIEVIERNDRIAKLKVTATLKDKHETSQATRRSRVIVLDTPQTE